jgi:integrase
VDIRALSEYLGHHDPAFTLRIYAHLMPGSEDRARQAIEAALSAQKAASSDTSGVSWQT